MLELIEWSRTNSLPARPWLILGKGPTFSHHDRVELAKYNLLSLNHAVRELKVDVAHIIDVDVVDQCREFLLDHCRWLLMPRRPHVNFDPGPLMLEDFARSIPVLRELDAQGRLVWYNLSSGKPVGESPVIRARFFSAEAALNVLAAIGVKQVRSLGVDGGRAYSRAFKDLEGKTMLANGHESFDRQFEEIERIVNEHSMDYAPALEPMRVFVGTDASQMVAAGVLEYSIRKHASRPVEFVPLVNMDIPLPKEKKNRPRTGFSFYRFLIPKLCGYRGRALYLDADMQVFSDLAELWEIPFGRHKVLCTNQPGVPDAWKNSSFFHAGRQMSVMLLDCSRLDWDIEAIVRGLDEGRFDYRQLMFELSVVKPDEIADLIGPEWNCLEWYDERKTKLLHYTVVPTQPWKNDENPLRHIWEACYREALRAGAVPRELVRKSIDAHLIKASLADVLEEKSTFRDRAHRLQDYLRSAGHRWRRRAGRAVRNPLGLIRKVIEKRAG